MSCVSRITTQVDSHLIHAQGYLAVSILDHHIVSNRFELSVIAYLDRQCSVRWSSVKPIHGLGQVEEWQSAIIDNSQKSARAVTS